MVITSFARFKEGLVTAGNVLVTLTVSSSSSSKRNVWTGRANSVVVVVSV